MRQRRENPPTILCVASFFKGNEFIRECRRQGAHVILLTREKKVGEDWARESLDDLLAVPGRGEEGDYLEAATRAARRRRAHGRDGRGRDGRQPLARVGAHRAGRRAGRSEEHTSEL